MNPNGNGIARRKFLRLTKNGALALLATRMPVMAGPFARDDFARLVPPDKKLDTEWVKSLTARGEPQVFRGADLEKIGMPVGGIGTGQIYLGGDGKLWHWDIFNQPVTTGDSHYAKPLTPASPLEQGFAIRIGDRTRALDRNGFADIRFRGEYPIGRVEYRDVDCPLTVTLEAFSPFIPLNLDDSGLPTTVMHFTVKNVSAEPVDAVLSGTLENAVCLHNRSVAGIRRNRIIAGNGFTLLECTAERPFTPALKNRPDLVFEDWNKPTYDGWTVNGTAFGTGPATKGNLSAYQGDVGGDTARIVNSHATAPGNDLAAKDNATGKLTSRPFVIGHHFITFWLGGGKRPGSIAVNLVIDGKTVCTATGQDDNRMALRHFDTAPFQGKQAVLEIVDEATGGWGNIGVGKITFTDQVPQPVALEALPDHGSMALALLGPAAEHHSGDATAPLRDKLTGELARHLHLPPGESTTVSFVLAWHFPNLTISGARGSGRFYATRFDSATAVARHVATNFTRLAAETRLWRDTWYDSTLPWWFLDRTFLNTSILATSTCHRFTDGRFYAWEGVGCCAGTCTSVWYYAQAPARLFPALERSVRERQDFADGIGFDPATGGVYTRGEFRGDFVLDGQAGNVLRVYREHLMSPDSAFLQRNWPKTKQALDWLIRQDGNNDGIIDGWQSTTLDCGFWWGAMSWTSSLYLAALLAGEAMAREMGEENLASHFRTIANASSKNLTAQLWNGEYFIHKPDRRQTKSFVIGNGCHIDQVYGQAWANQVGLGRVLPAEHTRSALRAIWKYNFTPDVGPYRKENPGGRWYAMAGEGGVIMTTWPHGDRENPTVMEGAMSIGVGYLNECMSGFEHQVAGHMIGEGLVTEGLAVERAIHDRYHAAHRNPWNEVECGDHYSRAMASYGVFLEACGFEYHGPRAHIGFTPRLTKENFRAAFTSAEAWGTIHQTTHEAGITVKWGKLRVKSLALNIPAATRVTANGQTVEFRQEKIDGKRLLTLAKEVLVPAGQLLHVSTT